MSAQSPDGSLVTRATQELIDRSGVIKRTAIIAVLNGEVAKPDSTFENILVLINADPVLGQRVIDVANSAWFGGRIKVETVELAIVRMGVKEFYRVVLFAALKAGLGGGRGSNAWLAHVENVATDCELMARCLARDLAPQAFLAGLMHDYGVPLMTKSLPEYAALAEEAMACTSGMEERENRRFQTNHCAVGAAMMTAWQFSPALVEVVRCHHKQTLAGVLDDEARRVLALLLLTERLDSMCRRLITIMFGESREEALLQEIAGTLEVTREKINEVLAEVARLYRLRQSHG
jgi:HD-like signal output (HDOD) protein